MGSAVLNERSPCGTAISRTALVLCVETTFIHQTRAKLLAFYPSVMAELLATQLSDSSAIEGLAPVRVIVIACTPAL